MKKFLSKFYERGYNDTKFVRRGRSHHNIYRQSVKNTSLLQKTIKPM